MPDFARFDADRVRANIRTAATEDLLERVTVDRLDMEPEAIQIMETELARRGVSTKEIDQFSQDRAIEVLRRGDGSAAHCSYCSRPAVESKIGWHRLWGRIPAFPRRLYFCPEHRRGDPRPPEAGT